MTTTTAAATTSVTSPESELTAQSKVRLDGIGPVKMGMTLAEASAATGRQVAIDPKSVIDGGGCGFASAAGGPQGLLFMVVQDRPTAPWTIVRLDVLDSSSLATGGGIRIGATEEDVKRVYGDRVMTEPHEYTSAEGGHYLTLDVDGPDGFLLLFETDGVNVLQYRSGQEAFVRAPEGCI